MSTITLRERAGVCRWCGCTHDDPCDGGCGWANRAQTLCTACVNVEQLVRTQAGRRELAEAVNFPEIRSAKSRPRRGSR